MGRARVTIAGMMGAVLVTACWLAALRSDKLDALRWFYALTIAILLLAVLAARLARAERRPFWFGFAVFGWAYLLLGLGLRPQLPSAWGPPSDPVVNVFLPSTEYLGRVRFPVTEQTSMLNERTRRA